jgi:hypothetical protein
MTDNQIKNLSDIELLQTYKSKALVCTCPVDDGCNNPRKSIKQFCGSQKIAKKVLTEIKTRHIILPELAIALNEDWSCGRRSKSSNCEFDEIMNDFIRNR